MILSLLLDMVVGTKEVIAIRQDFCRLWDCLISTNHEGNIYFTGSKSEGLNLPGSDRDYMHDINNSHNMIVIQSLDNNPAIHVFPNNVIIFNMYTERVPPGFALLQLVQTVHPTLTKQCTCLYGACKNINGNLYLGSDLFVDAHGFYDGKGNDRNGEIFKRQGPSLELWVNLRQIWSRS